MIKINYIKLNRRVDFWSKKNDECNYMFNLKIILKTETLNQVIYGELMLQSFVKPAEDINLKKKAYLKEFL